ncbi:MAG TPA: hypothetical protein VFU82_08580 [Gammaproteobacteria bacterium]|jgi:intracellular multiplication protein IcmL|nr:hypothetical protein [Gammaproteobacteria bacterium]
MLGRRSEIARLQSDFYRDQFRRMVRWLLVSVVIMLLLTAAIIYSILVQPARSYYANTTEGRIMLMPPEVSP